MPLDCLVDAWGSWSSRDENGKMTRTRSVIRQNKNEGKSCPPIEQTKLGKKKTFRTITV